MIATLKRLLRKPRVYEYRTTWHADGRSDRIVTQGEAEFIERYIPQKELDQLFGGFIRSCSPSSGREYLGVWGRREGGRFRRLLRESGARFEISRTAPFVRPKLISSTHVR